MKRSPSLNRLVLVLCVVVFAIVALVAQIAVLTELPTVAASLQAGATRVQERAHDALAGLSSPVQSANLDAPQEQVRAQAPSVPTASSPERAVQAAWQRAQQAGAYHFTTRIVQTTHLAPTIANVGKSSRVETILLEGEADLPAQTLLMRLWQDGGQVADASDGTEIRIEGDLAYGRAVGGEWQEIDNFSGGFAPGNDLMAYLVGAKNVQEIGTNSLPFDTHYSSLVTRYSFTLDGPAFADHIRDQLEQHLRENGELPPGLHLNTPDQLRKAIGDGEVWVDNDGLPLRLAIHLEYPQQRNGERVEADIQTDFTNYNRAALAQAPDVFDNPTAWLGNIAPRAQKTAKQASLGIAFLGLALLALTRSQSKKVYAALVIVVIVSMVVTPLLQSHQVYAFSQKQAARQAEYEQHQKDQEAVRELQEHIYGSDWDPQRDPLAGEQPNESAIRNTQYGIPPLASNGTSSSNEDDDDDGVPNDDDPCDDNPDCDGDGLTDLQETRLGTSLTDKDSDVDQINDDVEVAGFNYNGMWYTDPANPDTNNDGLTDTVECPQLIEDGPSPADRCQDTDNDGTPDVFDPDNDDDGVPDRVDLSPFSKMNNDGSPFNADNPLALIVNDLQPGEPAFVDFQLRPENQDHLWHALNVLDWPSGDEEGQIHRKKGNNSTFADVAPEGQPVAPNASNGDVRLIPMMEIEMTGDTIPLQLTNPEISAQVQGEFTGTIKLTQDGADIRLDFTFEAAQSYEVKIQDGSCLDPGDAVYTFTNVISGTTHTIDDRKLVNLADSEHIVTVSDGTNTECANLGNVINGPYDDQMIDPAPLKPYGISVREKNKDGVLLAYVPLGLVQDATGGDRVAFSARMHYRPHTDDWGDTQKVRVVWLVQMLVDQCTQRPCSDDANWLLDQTKVVYTYPEEWYLTGLSVREDHGLEVAIAFEDPSQEPSDEDRRYDDFLWKLADGLDATFLTGRDDDDDGLRDITISEIDARFDVTSTATITERWGIPLTVTMGVETFAYEHEDYAAHIMMTETRKVLSENFTDWVNQGSDAPSLLFARENSYLRVNLDENEDVAAQSALPDGNGRLLTMSLGEAKEETGVFLNWAPYRYRDDEWESYPVDEYWDKMEVRFKDIFDESDEDTRRGQLVMAQSFYASLFVGQSALVQVGVDITGNFEAQQSDADLTSGLSVGFSGGGIARLTKAYAGTWKKLFGVPYTLKKAKLAVTEKAEMRFRRKAYVAGAQALATFLIIGLYEVAAYTGAEWLTHTLNGVGATWAAWDAAVLGYTMYEAYKGSAKALSTLSAGPNALGMTLLGIGFLISQITMWGTFFSDMAKSGAKPGSLAYNYAASIQIAAMITAIVWIGFGLLPGIGQVMTVLGLFEGLLGLICGLTHSDNPICMRLTGMLTMGAQWWLYSSSVMLDFGDPDRFQLGSFDQKFKDPTKSMAVGNSLVVRGTVTNTIGFIDKMDIRGWHGQAYPYQYDIDTLRSSTFEYELSASRKDDIHEGLNRGDMEREWDGVDCYDKGNFTPRCYYDEDLSTQSPVEQAGINRPTPLYLSEGYAIPVQECWGIGIAPFIFPVCSVRTEKGTSPMNLSGMLKYDAFPATLDEFCSLNWSRGTYPTFHAQADHDGDGLRSRSYPYRGPDPNDRDWDSDDDQLSDFYEVQWGSNPQDYDSDNDGLSDRQEALLETDPYRADTDYDGLLDSEEVFHQNLTTGAWSGGWEFVYDFAEDGSQLRAWVTSDPLSIDGDNDGWTDFQEKTYGFHPRVASQKTILTFESHVREEDAPLLLLRLDETDGATTFRDASGYGNSAACEGDNCPAAGHHGRYGNAANFDGADDYVEVEVDVSETDYTLSLWFNTSCANCGIFSADRGTLGSSGNDRHLYLNGGNLCARVWNDVGGTPPVICTSGANYADGTWHHAAHVFGGSVGGQRLYVDGVQKASGGKASSDFDQQTGINIGFSNDAGSPYFDGLIDEVILFDRALSQSEIEELMAGRYNTADLIVRPGDTLYYRASVENELRGRYAQGLLSTDFPGAISGEIPPESLCAQPPGG